MLEVNNTIGSYFVRDKHIHVLMVSQVSKNATNHSAKKKSNLGPSDFLSVLKNIIDQKIYLIRKIGFSAFEISITTKKVLF